MAGNLSQKERTILQDQLRHEEVCINKYRDYAKRTSDSTLRGLFNEFAQDEQEHHNTLSGMLSGSQGQSQQAGAANAGQSRGGSSSFGGSGLGGSNSPAGSNISGGAVSDEEFIRAAAEERLQFRGVGQPTQSQWMQGQQQPQQQGQQQGQQQSHLQQAQRQAQRQQSQQQQSQPQGQQSQSSSNWPGTLQEASRELIPMFRTEMAQEFAGGTGMGESDASIVRDMLMTEQFVSGSYDTAIFDSVSQNVRQTLQHIQKDEQKHGQGLRDYMQRRGLGQQ